MKRLVKRLTVFVVCASLCFGLGLLSADAQPQRERKPITWVNPTLPKGPGLEHKVLSSRALGHDVGYVVWTPEDYDAKGENTYSVIYFLHGMGGTESADAAGFSSLVSRGMRDGNIPPSLCVFPNGGRSGYRGDVETMIVDELIPLIDRTYRTRQDAASRAVAGFSMGGGGAVRLSLRHPDLFCAAGSWGGGMFGGPDVILEAAKSNADALRKNNFALLLVNGDNDRPDAFATLAETMKSLQIPCEVVVLKDTNHNLGLYYDRAGTRMAEFLGKQLKLGLHTTK
jgi:enterochelin esterase-like enzyme